MDRRIPFLAFLILLSACGPKITPTPQQQVDVAGTAVAAALTALPPQPTYTPYPTFTPYPTPDITGMFCEYDFCIGHPSDVPLFDLEVANGYTTNASSYSQGLLLGYLPNLVFIEVLWQLKGIEWDPQVMLAAALQTDSAQPTTLTEDFDGRPVAYTLLARTPSDILPYGLVAAWPCGDRQFGWKVYTPQDGQGNDYLRQALSRFRCADG